MTQWSGYKEYLSVKSIFPFSRSREVWNNEQFEQAHLFGKGIAGKGAGEKNGPHSSRRLRRFSLLAGYSLNDV